MTIDTMSYWKPGQDKPTSKNAGNQSTKTQTVPIPSSSAKSQSMAQTASQDDNMDTDDYYKPSEASMNSQQNSNNISSNNAKPTTPTNAKLELSKAVMGMKFMKRKAEDIANEEEDKSKKMRLSTGSLNSTNRYSLDSAKSEARGDEMTETGPMGSIRRIVGTMNVLSTSSYPIHDQINQYPGRRSFGGFNKPVERNYQETLDDLRYQKLSTSKKSSKYDVDDNEMVERYKDLIGLPRGPNQGKIQHKNHHKK